MVGMVRNWVVMMNVMTNWMKNELNGVYLIVFKLSSFVIVKCQEFR